jgi:ABC-type glucose/galactose transport system permease subunit
LVVGAAALGLALVADQVPFLSEATNPALVILGAAVIVLAIYWLWWGTSFVKSRLPRGTLVERIRLSGSASVGFAMLSAFAGCAAFLAFNAGLKLAGL